MPTQWILEAASIFLTTVGALLAFLAHYRLGTQVAAELPPETRQRFLRQHLRLTVALALIAAALVLQCAAFFFI